MPKLTPEEIVDKQIRNAQNAVEDVVKGIERMKETPGASAVKKKDKMRAGFLKSLEDGTYEAGCLSYSISDFQRSAIPKVRERYASGVAASREKSLEARKQLSAHQEAIERHVAAMPDTTDVEREQRMLYNMREMKKFKLKRMRR